jgi:periplasmic divalent cation tolerance protein
MRDKNIIIFYVPFEDITQAREMSKYLLENKLIVCANMITSDSQYIWNGQMESGKEIIAIFKTTTDKKEETAFYLEKKHPYDTPLIGCIEMEVNQKYLDWARDVLL